MTIHDLPTPALLLDLDLFEANLHRMAEHARKAGKRLRPHAKAHKCVEIAKRQIAAGAVGVCAATVAEAELMVRGGIEDVLLTTPVMDPLKGARIAALTPHVKVVVDHEQQVEMYEAAGATLDVLVDMDTGDGRTGVASVECAVALARRILGSKRLRFAGLQAYSVQASHTGVQAPMAVVERARDAIGSVPVVTGGSTGSYRVDARSVLTEVQPGSYALMDLQYRRMGVDFANAMTVLTSVVSGNRGDRVTVDAGFKAFSTDRPFGPELLDDPGMRYEWAGDEFGYLFGRFDLGRRLRMIPPHCDPTVNLYDRIYVVRGEAVEDVWPVMARTGSTASKLRPTAVNFVLNEVRRLGTKPVSLMRGEPDFPTPAHVVEAGVRALREGRTAYPDNRGELALREAVTAKLHRVNGLSYDPGSEILVTDGATLGIHAAIHTVAGAGDEILMPDPVYDAYQSPVRLVGAEPRRVHSTWTDGRFTYDREALEAAWSPAARALLINTPWNPVGTVLTRSELAGIADFVERRNLMLISDEIYEAITYDGHEHVSPASLSEQVRRRCILINSFSKTYAMTGWRLGYCAATPEVIRTMFLVLQQSSRGPATFVQDAGVAALQGLQDCVAEMVAEYARRRRAVTDALNGIPRVAVYPPEGGFFAIVDIRGTGRTSNDVRTHLLERHNVSVMHGRAYGPAGEGMLRVSFASGGSVLNGGLQLLREGLAAL
jgi:aspartate/methionine/tyrosine aminotransferase/D-serine deaminase-like pyridoxal phosphate-dependent protein